MTEHRGASFAHSCVKVPLDPYSRQPTPAYERPKLPVNVEKDVLAKISPRRHDDGRCSKLSASMDNKLVNSLESCRSQCEHNEPQYLQGMPDLYDVQHLTDEQFKQRLDYLKRRQRLLLKNLRNCLEQEERAAVVSTPSVKNEDNLLVRDRLDAKSPSCGELALKGRRCVLESSRPVSPVPYPYNNFSCLAENQDLLTYRRNPELCRYKECDKAAKTRLNEKTLAADKCWSSSSESKSPESDEPEAKVETKSLPPHSPSWRSTTPKPFGLTLREDADKYVSLMEQELANSEKPSKKNPAKKRRIRPVPLTSKIPLYDKLMAEKEERSRLVREESALSLLSQVRPFKLECERRALRALTRSSPELSCSDKRNAPGRFRAKPVPRSLFSNDVYERMLEDEYFRSLQKRIRAAELLKSASLPPSMARRERSRSTSACSRSRSEPRASSSAEEQRSATAHVSPAERARSAALLTALPPHGTNLAALLRAQASREKLEREIQERLEEKRREQMLRLRKSMISRKPAWRALRFAARHEHERDLDFRASLRRDEARVQAERHRLQMEMMLDRVTRIPTLFERYSQPMLSPEDEALLQSFQCAMQLRAKLKDDEQETSPRRSLKAKKKKKKQQQLPSGKRQTSSSTESYVTSSSRPGSGSLTSSSSTPPCLCHSSMSCKAAPTDKKKVSINETAELIEDADRQDEDKESFSVDSATSQLREEREKRILGEDGDVTEKE